MCASLTPYDLPGTALRSAKWPPGSAGGTVRRAGLYKSQQARSAHGICQTGPQPL